jgi:hypothetical protein
MIKERLFLPALYFIKDIEEMVGLFVLFGEVDI